MSVLKLMTMVDVNKCATIPLAVTIVDAKMATGYETWLHVKVRVKVKYIY